MSGKKQWPKLKRDYPGLRVRLLVPIQNGFGKAAPAGALATVEESYGGLKLSVDICDKCGTQLYVSKVPESKVELV